MIPLSQPQWQTDDWQQQLSGAVDSLDQLMALLDLAPEDAPWPIYSDRGFALRVPRAFVERMEPGNWRDPLLLQVLPQAREQEALPGYSHDPLQEREANPVPGLIHKYHGRVLLVATPACAIHCRYCFRRHFPYDDNRPSRAQWHRALDYIAGRESITEVILSGGDPLSANDRRLAELVSAIADIPHVRRLRVHTRLPVVLPARVTEDCISALCNNRLQTVVVIHANHAQELDDAVGAALRPLRERGATLLNQSVLLAGVNDDAAALCQLSEKLFGIGVLPYYLHVLDRVTGAGHFERSDAVARNLHRQMMASLPGYLVPKLVREDPRCGFKTPL